MRPAALGATVGSALLGLAAQPAFASTAHRRAHQHFGHNHTHHDHGVDENLELLKPRGRLVNRSGQCAFPEGEAGLVTITPSSLNKGWAMSPDQECTAGSYCPFACEPGMVMNQWKKGTTYQYPESMDGGLYCDEDGAVNKPFPDEPYCVEGVGTVNAVNNCGDMVAFCQTVLPGNEAMLIPTSVSDSVVISVPGPSYWDSTASHFYINPPGYSTEEACAWGTGLEAIGNWSPYVAGANQDSTGNTYVKIGYNPIYTSSYYGVKPSFGLKVECDGNCNGLPCSIDPSTDGFGVVSSAESSTGAGGADFCVVTVPEGASANIVVFSTGESTESSSSSSSAQPKTTSQPPKTSTTSSAVIAESTSTTTFASSTSVFGGIFHESAVTSATGTFDEYSASAASSVNVADATTVAVPAAATTSSKSDAANPDQGRAAFAGLVIAFAAAAVLY
ncbi:putative secreted beta-glucosidase adg3 [Cytospora mali]|uniref:Secreted beta-glucosidase adg3 n=1 Tax=Cytospora mali TaxID=578113 RepID=A0A194VVV2_CYTMA|nr:putative secreted beta-glucosidase adg3 [Valsa mali]